MGTDKMGTFLTLILLGFCSGQENEGSGTGPGDDIPVDLATTRPPIEQRPVQSQIIVQVPFTVPSTIAYSAELEDSSSTLYQEKARDVEDFFRPSLLRAAEQSNSVLVRIDVAFSQYGRRRRQAADESAALATVVGVYRNSVALSLDEISELDVEAVSTQVQTAVQTRTTSTLEATDDNDIFVPNVELAFDDVVAEKQVAPQVEETTTQTTTTTTSTTTTTKTTMSTSDSTTVTLSICVLSFAFFLI